MTLPPGAYSDVAVIPNKRGENMNVRNWLFGIALAAASTVCAAQGAWTPQKNVEIVVGSAPGGSNDRTARQVERILVEKRIVSTPLTVVNKPGGGSTIAFNYVNQHAGAAHYLMVGTTAQLTNHIAESSQP